VRVPSGKQQDRLPLSISGTLGTGVAFQGIKSVVIHTILTVPLGQAMEEKPLPLPYSPTGTTPPPLDRYISYMVDQGECVVEGIRWIKSRMDKFK
jgi:hypothetical protein